jgi:hypothetical protein
MWAWMYPKGGDGITKNRNRKMEAMRILRRFRRRLHKLSFRFEAPLTYYPAALRFFGSFK